jgi:hypothetical protein
VHCPTYEGRHAAGVAEHVRGDQTREDAGDGQACPFGELEGEHIVGELGAAGDLQAATIPPKVEIVQSRVVGVPARVGHQHDAAGRLEPGEKPPHQ